MKVLFSSDEDDFLRTPVVCVGFAKSSGYSLQNTHPSSSSVRAKSDSQWTNTAVVLAHEQHKMMMVVLSPEEEESVMMMGMGHGW